MTPEIIVSKGDIVGYVLDEGDSGTVRPAIVVHVWGEETVQLQVFTDGKNDGLPNVIWKTSVPYSEDPAVRGGWHWLGARDVS